MNWFLWTRRVSVLVVLAGVTAAPAAFLGQPWLLAHSLGPVTIGLYLDAISTLLLAFVGLLVWVVTTYSLTNLRGRDGLAPAGRALFAALLGLVVMVASASLVTVALGWTVSGLAVGLVVARTGTGRAPVAARTMRRHLLVGDLALWSGIVVGLVWLPSLDRTRLGEVTSGAPVVVVAVLLVVACVTRSGLVPSHRWLAETAEAPSPVSALLHAGVVNGAGVLGVLAWPLFRAAPLVLLGLLVLGAASVVIGAWAGRVRSDVKGRLACSTTSQMGYMCVQLGLGLPAMALMHLLGHGAYKSWMFLRAGGAIARNRDHAPSAPTAPLLASRLAPWAAAVVAAGTAALVGAPAARELTASAGVTALIPVTLVVLCAVVAARAAACLPRATGVHSLVAIVAAGIAAGLYGWVLVGWEHALTPALPRDAVWDPLFATVLVAGLVVAGAAVVVGSRSLSARPDSPLAVRLLPTALAPKARHRRYASLPRCAGPYDSRHVVSGPVAGAAVMAAAATVGTSWPLRNMVAANPLARLESMPFDDALDVASRAHSLAGASPVTGRAPLRYYLDLFDSGRIHPSHLAAALAEVGDAAVNGTVGLGTGGPATSEPGLLDPVPAIERLVADTRSQVAVRTASTEPRDPVSVLRFCAALSPSSVTHTVELVDAHAALWAQRAWPTTGSDAPGATDHDPSGPWDRWIRAAARPSYDAATGIRGAAAWVRTLPEDPAAAIEELARRVELRADLLVGYLVATLASAPGWSAHASWRARRSGETAPLLQLAALRMAHDVLFSGAVSRGRPRTELALSTVDAEAATGPTGPASVTSTETARIWQRALEIGVEEWLLTRIVRSIATSDLDLANPETGTRTGTETRAAGVAGRPQSQSLWCIDVRSERVRRHLEESGDHRTYGYAGFFGAAVRYLNADGVAHDQCPALIEPSFTARRRPTPLRFRQVLHRSATAVSATPLGALVVAEGGGILAALSSTSALLAPATVRRFVRGWIGDDTRAEQTPLVTDLGLREKVDLAVAALRSTGLTENFAPLIVVCGHGSTTENNAFGTAYDCGACGGNDGRVNAALLVDALNDDQVRARLADQGLRLPVDTLAVAALHDTSTDEITLARPGEHPEIEAALTAAGRRAALERERLLPVSGRTTRPMSRPVARRAADWSEPTPEWGLAGNAAIVFGPRELTIGTDLGSRVFLHGYDRHGDRDGSVLEQLMTAPLVVAQWINAQYYFSAVDPDTFGAGDKTTHNVVGDVGVLTGAHGDLRTGLPWQSLFRQPPGTGPLSQSLVHEPVRLLAVVDAEPDVVAGIVERHETLTQLVGNEWIRLVCLDAGQAITLLPDLTWRPWRMPSTMLPSLREERAVDASTRPTGRD
ncbi:hypothetical protein BA895_14635 [Humibacillus sp. DSM 29435]|uniref:putative inorganic carbon transporter subunit DabA n=1 Tax=Humibacillus sp. DSM 29435 TaxID=1869167 RepID=UPI00087261D9|nr:putative inorganic carbon transporter subunit DabA [Humibacillus sp. DSM 29435]OFE17720.1 hypothetical protein BA895_14635 [Humibacillus sp. DSM 29435]